MLSLPTIEPHAEARVVINERAGSVVIGGDVEIGSVVVTHKNIVIETGDNMAANRFVPLDAGKDLDRQAQVAGRIAERRQGADRGHHRHHQRAGTQRQTARHADHRITRLRSNQTMQIQSVDTAAADRRTSTVAGRRHRRRAEQLTAEAGTTAERRCGKAFDSFVGETFYGQMLKSMRKTVGKAAYFDGGRARRFFAASSIR